MAQANYEIRRKCPICGTVFQIRTIDSVYCSKQCSDIAYKRKKDRERREYSRQISNESSFFVNSELKIGVYFKNWQPFSTNRSNKNEFLSLY